MKFSFTLLNFEEGKFGLMASLIFMNFATVITHARTKERMSKGSDENFEFENFELKKVFYEFVKQV